MFVYVAHLYSHATVCTDNHLYFICVLLVTDIQMFPQIRLAITMSPHSVHLHQRFDPNLYFKPNQVCAEPNPFFI